VCPTTYYYYFFSYVIHTYLATLASPLRVLLPTGLSPAKVTLAELANLGRKVAGTLPGAGILPLSSQSAVSNCIPSMY